MPDWHSSKGSEYLPPSGQFLFGTDLFGRDVFAKVIHGTKIAMSVGLVTSLIAIPIGVTIGAVAGYFGGLIDDIVTWFITTFSSIPNIMLLISITLIMGKGLAAVYLALGMTGWVGLARLIRGEVMKHKEREYVQAASALGGGHFRKLFIHILPNVTHIVIINTSLQFQTAIKSEVILSYLGLGVQGEPSWGTMIDDARMELARGVWWQLAGATLAMFIVVLAFNILGDALRDALDPKLKGK
jgi:peptide/nickel transport system permease protein